MAFFFCFAKNITPTVDNLRNFLLTPTVEGAQFLPNLAGVVVWHRQLLCRPHHEDRVAERVVDLRLYRQSFEGWSEGLGD